MVDPQTQVEQPLIEKALPQASIRFFMFLIGVCAVVMVTFRAAIVGDAFWAKCASVVLATAIGCFLAYAALFLIANLFSTATAGIVELPLDKKPSIETNSSGDAVLQSSSATREDT